MNVPIHTSAPSKSNEIFFSSAFEGQHVESNIATHGFLIRLRPLLKHQGEKKIILQTMSPFFQSMYNLICYVMISLALL